MRSRVGMDSLSIAPRSAYAGGNPKNSGTPSCWNTPGHLTTNGNGTSEMADDDGMGMPDSGQLLHADLTGHVRTRVEREIDGILESAEELRGLALRRHPKMTRLCSPEPTHLATPRAVFMSVRG